jgi:replicative DNA helicase
MQVAMHVAVETKIPTLIFSVEMPGMQVMCRALCGRIRVNLQRVRDGFFSRQEIERMHTTFGEMHGAPLYLDESAGLTTTQLRSRARAAKVKHGIGLIVVDYLQFMRGATKQAKDNRQLEVAEISATLKMVAKELKVPVIALAQLGREADESSMPKLSHLRESGSIEQDADQVLLIHRLDKKRKQRASDPDEEGAEDHNTLLLLEKQRNGPTGPIKLFFEKEYTVFRNVTPKPYSSREEERQR